MAGAAATTFYDVITRYKVHDDASPALGRYSDSSMRAHRSNRALFGSTRSLGRSFGMLAAAAAPITGGVVGLAAFGYAGYKAFSNLNTEMRSTIQLAAQLNLAFEFTPDPGKNFVSAMREGQRVFKDLVRDAAALPGEMEDFLSIGSSISGPVFAAGGSADTYRELIAKIALATPAAGGSFDQAGLAAGMMLSGAGRTTSPLTRFMVTSNLLEGHDVSSFNALMKKDGAEGLRIFTSGLSKFVDDPAFRKAILGTFETQSGTMMELLFGSTGITGQLFGDTFDGFLDGMVEFNETIEEYTPGIVSGLKQTGSTIGDLFGILGGLPWGLITTPLGLLKEYGGPSAQLVAKGLRFEKYPVMFRESGQMEEGSNLFNNDRRLRNKEAYASFVNDQEQAWTWEHQVKPFVKDREIFERDLYEQLVGIRPPVEPEQDVKHKGLTDPAKVEQTFNIKLDLKSDISPEAIAVNVTKAIEIAGKHRTTIARGTSLIPNTGALA